MIIVRIERAVKAAQAKQHSKLKVVMKMSKSQCKTRCVDIGCYCKRIRRVLTKPREGTAELRV